MSPLIAELGPQFGQGYRLVAGVYPGERFTGSSYVFRILGALIASATSAGTIAAMRWP